jgi:hypothetical protein
MRPLQRAAWAAAVALLAAGGGSARAAWNNVFQVCCHHCRSAVVAASPVVAVPAAPVSACPQQCTTRYVQRSFYQPVTTYQQQTFYEPVTTYRTSFFWEQVCSYRYSCYFDPCTCSYQQVATPVTSFRLRSQCCPVTSYLQRCMLKPVCSYQLAYYFEPQTTCCTTTIGAPVACPPGGAAVVPGTAAVPAAAVPGTPTVTEPPPTPPAAVPNVQEGTPSSTESQKIVPVPAAPGLTMPRAPETSSSYRQPAPRTAPAQAPPAVRLDRIVSLPAEPKVEGQVVRQDSRPHAGARLLFVSADRQGVREAATADAGGRFQVTLAAGGWLVYLHGADGKPVFQQRVQVRDAEARPLMLVSR